MRHSNLLRSFLLLLILAVAFHSCSTNGIDTGDFDGSDPIDEPEEFCSSPSDLSVHAIEGTSNLLFNWTSGDEETNWMVEYGETGFVHGTGTTQNVTTNAIELVGLYSTTAYDFYVKAICSDELTSDWVGPVTSEVVSVAPNHAMMTATIDGVYYSFMQPVLYGFNDAVKIDVVSDETYLWIQGNTNPTAPGATGNREINLHLHQDQWEVGSYDLVSEGGTVDSYFNIIIQDPNTIAHEVEGTINITNFNTAVRVVEGTFELYYEIYKTDTGITTGPFTAAGTFDYSLDAEYFD